MINVLLTCCGRRHYLASYFKQVLGQSGRVVGVDKDLTSPGLQACDVAHQVPGIFDPGYLDSLKKVILKENINMVFSLNDLEAELLAQNSAQLEQKTGAIFYVPSVPTLKVCIDKWSTFEFGRKIGISVPETFLSPEGALKSLDLGHVKFPLIIKPRRGTASMSLYFAESRKELEIGFAACLEAVTKNTFFSLGLDQSVIIQELIQGSEYGLDILYGCKENFIGFTAKRKLAMRAGETDRAVTVGQEYFFDAVNKIVQNLPHRGNLDCDFLERNGVLYLLEFNPRFGGGYPFTHLSGANHLQILIDDYKGKKISSYNYKIGKTFAKFDSLVEVPFNYKTTFI